MKKQFYHLAAIIVLLPAMNLYAQAQDWHLGGNAGTGGAFIGTTSVNPQEPFPIYTGNEERMRIDTFGNVGIGLTNPSERLSVLSGNIQIATPANSFMLGNNSVLWHNNITSNIYLGVGAGSSYVSGADNTFVGNNAGTAITSGNENTFIGSHAGFANVNNIRNTFIGYSSGRASTGNRNTFTGHASGAFNSGDDNIFIGFNTGTFNSGNFNTYIGNNSGSDTSSGGSNTFIGYRTGENNTSGSENTLLGLDAGRNNISGSRNTFVGNRAGEASTGSNNTYIGYNARGTDTLTNAAAIGYNASVTANNSMALGGTGADAVKVGIGVTNPGYTLDVNGTIAAKKILINSDDTTQDLLAMIQQLQNEVAELKMQLTAMAKN